jgi:hypothetical protein
LGDAGTISSLPGGVLSVDMDSLSFAYESTMLKVN